MTTNLDSTRPAGRAPLRRRMASLVFAGGIVAGGIGLGACGTGTAAPGPRSPVPLARTPLTRQDTARQAAEAILAELKLPPGLHFDAGEPAGDHGALARASSTYADPNLVDLARFATGSGDPSALIQWMKAHPPAGSKYSGSGFEGGPSELSNWEVTLSWPPVGQLLDTRQLVVEALTLADGKVAMRFDAQVTWLPAKPGGDLVPPGVTVLTVSLTKGLNPGEPGHAATTTTDPAVIAAVRDHLDSLPVASPGVSGCPADFGQDLMLEFFDHEGGKPVTVVDADPAGCGSVQVSRAGKDVTPSLSDAGGAFVSFVETEMGWSANA